MTIEYVYGYCSPDNEMKQFIKDEVERTDRNWQLKDDKSKQVSVRD